MSQRSDWYLSLCLEQANKSPLHFRHGCIIVHGGKVIGQGFNAYSPGFDGGALKHGNHASTLKGLSAADFKQHMEHRTKQKYNAKQPDSTFTPFEGIGSAHHTSKPLSMHSEMMAIQSALSRSAGTLSSQKSARAAKWLQKPCFQIPTAPKRKARLRFLKAYVQAIYTEPETDKSTVEPQGGKSCFGKSHFETTSPQSSQGGQQWRQGRGKIEEFIDEEEWEERLPGCAREEAPPKGNSATGLVTA